MSSAAPTLSRYSGYSAPLIGQHVRVPHLGYWWPYLTLPASIGLLVVALANRASQAGGSWAQPLFWGGVLLLYAPMVAALASRTLTRVDRIVVVVLLGSCLYFVKVMQSPVSFTLPDELNMLYNVNQILETNHLFQENPLAVVTHLFPGLLNVATALQMTTGVGVFEAGIIVIGIARIVLSLSLYLLFEQLSGSARVAGLASALYTGHTNYLIWHAQFSYESLALPLMVMVAFMATRFGAAGQHRRVSGLMALAVLSLVAITVTHHVTSYAMTAFLWCAFALAGILRKREAFAFGGLAFLSTVSVTAWAYATGGATVTYLAPMFTRMVQAGSDVLTGSATVRALFGGASVTSGAMGAAGPIAPPAPDWEKAVAVGSMVLILLIVPVGLVYMWRHYRTNTFVLVLAGAALGFFPVQAFRLTGGGWEVSVRSAAFLFAGIAFVIAVTLARLGLPGPRDARAIQRTDSIRAHLRAWVWLPITSGIILIICAGGIAGGWPHHLRVALPYLIETPAQTLEPQGVTTAKLTREILGEDNPMVADGANIIVFLVYGEQRTHLGVRQGFAGRLFTSSTLGRWEADVLQFTGSRYVIADRRINSLHAIQGIFFDRSSGADGAERRVRDVQAKFDERQTVSRLVDSGDIAIYDVEWLGSDTTLN